MFENLGRTLAHLRELKGCNRPANRRVGRGSRPPEWLFTLRGGVAPPQLTLAASKAAAFQAFGVRFLRSAGGHDGRRCSTSRR